MSEETEWAPKQDMSLLCRVCANQHDYLIPIFQGEGLDHDMPTKMDKHLPIKVRENDKLPTQMCYQCASTIIAWSELHTNCLAADKKLKGMLKINEKKSGEVDNDDAASDHYEDSYDDGGGAGADDDEDFEQEIKQLISDAGVELGQKTTKATKRPSRAVATRKRKAEVTITPVKREPKKLKTEPKSSTALLKPKEEVVTNDDSTSKCSQCQADFTTQADLIKHFNTSHPPEHFVCDFCKTTFLLKTQLRKHMREHIHSGKVEKLRICQLCPATFPRKRGSSKLFNEHVKTVHSEFAIVRKKGPIFQLCSCHICGKIFQHRYLLRNHLPVHNQEWSFLCDVPDCGAKFRQKRYLIGHKKIVHDKFKYNPLPGSDKKEEYPCPNCGKMFFTVKGRVGHLANCGAYVAISKGVDHTEYNLIKSFQRRSRVNNGSIMSFQRRSRVNNGSNSLGSEMPQEFPCEICNKKFPTASKMFHHKYRHTREYKDKVNEYQRKKQPVVCPQCGVCTKKLSQHVRSQHSNIKDYTCDICNKEVKRKDALEKHMRVHTGERPYVCFLCGNSYKQSPDMMKHQRKVHNYEPVAKRRAAIKLEDSTEERYLTRHKKYIHEKNPYPCRQNEDTIEHPCTSCGKLFSSIKSMFAHSGHCGAYVESISEVDGSNPVVRTTKSLTIRRRRKCVVTCDVCNKGFSTTQSMLNHKFRHSREYKDKMSAYMRNKKPVMCPQCGIFTKTLSQHLQLHTAKYTCKICNKIFKRKDYLESHMRVHTGERPYVCFLCGNSYKQRTDMDRHQRKAHNYEPVVNKRSAVLAIEQSK